MPLVLAFVLTACDAPPSDGVDTDDPPDTDVLVPHHTISLYNGSGDVDATCAVQLTRLELTPVDGGDPIVRDFVVNPRAETTLSIPMPVTATFRVEVFPTPDGPSIWWDDQAMAPRGTTTVYINGINTGFLENSRCNGMLATGSTLVCGE